VRSQEEINKEKEKLKKLKKTLPEFSFFGTNNWQIIDVQLDIIEGIIDDEDEIWDRKEELGEDEVNQIVEAFQWLNGEIDSLTGEDEVVVETESSVDSNLRLQEAQERLDKRIAKIEERKKKELAKPVVERFRTRWKRWLGQKCRYDKPNWTSLLDSNWSAWCSSVYLNHDIQYTRLSPFSDLETIRLHYLKAIEVATMQEFSRLDGLYVEENLNRKYK
jgi:hypothetical protein